MNPQRCTNKKINVGKSRIRIHRLIIIKNNKEFDQITKKISRFMTCYCEMRSPALIITSSLEITASVSSDFTVYSRMQTTFRVQHNVNDLRKLLLV